MADIHGVPGPSMMVADISPADAGAMRDDDLAATTDALSGPNPHPVEMNLPNALSDDGGEQGL